MCSPSDTPPPPLGGAAAVMADAARSVSELTAAPWWAVGDGELLRLAIEMETLGSRLSPSGGPAAGRGVCPSKGRRVHEAATRPPR
jgi:hypothetical protein